MRLSLPAQKLYRFLSREANLSETQDEQIWIKDIEKKRRALTARSFISPDWLIRLNNSRASISHSLKENSDELSSWHKANGLINSWLSHKQSFDLTKLKMLNAMLTGKSLSLTELKWRNAPIYTCRVKHLEANELEAMMQAFYCYMLSTLAKRGGLYAAFICRYWIVSIHPFADANGRSSQLMADFLLFQYGYLPQAFTSITEALIVGDPVNRPHMNTHQAFKRFIKTLSNAYELLLDAPQCKNMTDN